MNDEQILKMLQGGTEDAELAIYLLCTTYNIPRAISLFRNNCIPETSPEFLNDRVLCKEYMYATGLPSYVLYRGDTFAMYSSHDKGLLLMRHWVTDRDMYVEKTINHRTNG